MNDRERTLVIAAAVGSVLVHAVAVLGMMNMPLRPSQGALFAPPSQPNERIVRAYRADEFAETDPTTDGGALPTEAPRTPREQADQIGRAHV